jgi:hypothetical protein
LTELKDLYLGVLVTVMFLGGCAIEIANRISTNSRTPKVGTGYAFAPAISQPHIRTLASWTVKDVDES